MTNKTSNQQDDIWNVIAKGLADAIKMVFGIFSCVFVAGVNAATPKKPADTTWHDDDGFRNGHSGPGYYEGDVRLDKDDD